MSPKTEKQYEEMRQRSAAIILQAALELFGHKGYHSTSISQIAKEAGVSKGLIYNYFSSKEALLEAIVVEAAKVGEGLMEILEQEQSTQEKLKLLIESSFALIQSNLHYWKLMTSLAFQPEVVEKFEDMIKNKSQEIFDVLEALFAEMNVANPKEEAYFLGATMDGIALHYMNMGEVYPLEKMINYTIQKFCRY